jgi:hypothetical protein
VPKNTNAAQAPEDVEPNLGETLLRIHLHNRKQVRLRKGNFLRGRGDSFTGI